ncbi:hypothetical protein IFO70_37810 [Phormidium tenue FACHB-886]|nr:hypothetical protein [Phormidium tenue FACHB-886]
MFHFRLDKVKINKNREEGGVLGLGKDLAELELWSFVTTDNQQLPDVSELLSTNNSSIRKELVTEIAQAVVASRQTKKVDKIKDGAEMNFGFDLWQAPTTPAYFDWNFVVIELDEDQRKTAQIIENITSDNAFEHFTDSLPGKLLGAANPGFEAVAGVTRLVVDVVKANLNNSDNDTVGLLYKSFSQAKHYPTGEAEEKNVQDITNNMWVDFSIYSD